MIPLHFATLLLWMAKGTLAATNIVAPYLFRKVENILDKFYGNHKFQSVNEYLEHKENDMDKQIKKVKKDVKKAEKDTNSLLKLDKAHDKKMAKCDKMMKKKKS